LVRGNGFPGIGPRITSESEREGGGKERRVRFTGVAPVISRSDDTDTWQEVPWHRNRWHLEVSRGNPR